MSEERPSSRPTWGLTYEGFSVIDIGFYFVLLAFFLK